MSDIFNSEMVFPKHFKPVFCKGKFCDLHFIGYDYKSDSTLKVLLGFTKTKYYDKYYDLQCSDKNLIVERKIELTKAIVNGIDYAEDIVDDFFSFDGTMQYFELDIPFVFALNSRALASALKESNKITLEFKILDFEYENEEDREDNYYAQYHCVDTFTFDVNQ